MRYNTESGILLLSAVVLLVNGAFAQITETKLTAGDGGAGDNFGKSVSLSGDYALIGAYLDHSFTGSAYIFHHDGTSWTEEAKLTASDGAIGDLFGNSVSLSGDYAIVGAYGDEDNGVNSGSAYIFHRDGTSWTEDAKLTASDGAIGDLFGNSVSLSGDYALVGAYSDEDNGVYSGSAYIFHRNGTSWTEEAKLTAGDGAAYDNFGNSVSLSSDYALIGAPGDDVDSGSAYIFHRDVTSWTEEAKLTASDGAAYDNFGSSVSLSSDYALIGAYLDDDNGSASGSAYIFHRDSTRWTEEAKLTAGDGAAYDNFGYSVALSGDYALAGAYADDDNGFDSGSAYIFRRDATSWTEEAKLTASDGAESDLFGWAVSLSGNYALMGAWGDDDNGLSSGSAYVYNLDSIVTSIEDPEGLPNEFALSQNYPNPFNPTTTIEYSLPRSSYVRLEVFNVLGEEVATLVSGPMDAGIHTIQWDATGQPSGVYFYRLRAGGEFVETKKLLLLR